MNYLEFIDSLTLNACPDQLDPCLQALWYDATGDWNTAHEIVQRLDNATAARIHAYLHRKAMTGIQGTGTGTGRLAHRIQKT